VRQPSKRTIQNAASVFLRVRSALFAKAQATTAGCGLYRCAANAGFCYAYALFSSICRFDRRGLWDFLVSKGPLISGGGRNSPQENP